MRYITILLLFVTFPILGQNENNHWLMENNGNNEVGTMTLIAKNGITYTSAYKIQGTYSLWSDALYKRVITSAKFDASSGGRSFVGSVRNGSSSGIRVILSGRLAGGDKQGTSIEIDGTNRRLVVVQDAGATQGSAYSANSSLSITNFDHFAVVIPDMTQDVVRIYINGVRSGTDSIGLAGGQFNDTISIAAYRDGGYNLSGGIDNLQTYDRALTDAEVLDLYLHRTEDYYLSDEPYVPPVTYEPTIWMKYKGVAKIPKFRGITKYVGYTPLTPLYAGYLKPGLDNRLSHNQYMVTYDGAFSGDIVGTFDPWYVTDHKLPGVYTYSLNDDESGIYAINSTTGIITIHDNTSLVDGTDTLEVSITLGSITEKYNVFVTVKDVADVIHVKPGAPTNGSGTRGSPKNTWSGMTFTAGKMYVQERGTTSSVGININQNGTDGNPIIVAAYGNGARPIVNTNYAGRGISIRGNYIQCFEYNLVNNIGAIALWNITAIYHDILLSDIECSGSSGDEAQIYLHKPHNDFVPPYWTFDWRLEMYDIVATGAGSSTSYSAYGMKYEGGTIYSRNIKTINHWAQGISQPFQAHGNHVIGLLSYGNGRYALEWNGRNCEVEQSYLQGGWAALIIMDRGADTISIHHNELVGGGYRGTMWISASSTNTWTGTPQIHGQNITIENNIIRGSTDATTAGIYLTDAVHNVRIRKNYIYDHPTGIRLSTGTAYVDSLRDIQMDQNVFHSNTNYDIYNLHGQNVYARNNSMTGTVFSTPAMYFLNNFYKTLTNPGVSNNNIDIDAINVNTYFVNWASNDLRLKSTATLAIDHGLNLGLTPDIDGVIIPQGTLPDIGAYEYK
jgi:hypothetical protein